MGQRIIWSFSFFLLRILTLKGYAPISVLGVINQFLPMEDNKIAYSHSIFAFFHPANIFISQFLVISACVLTTMPALFPDCQHKNASVIQFCVCICWARGYLVWLSTKCYDYFFFHIHSCTCNNACIYCFICSYYCLIFILWFAFINHYKVMAFLIPPEEAANAPQTLSVPFSRIRSGLTMLAWENASMRLHIVKSVGYFLGY